jgi:hypothetical protein
MHFDGADWTRLETGALGDLLWVFGLSGGPVYMGGDGGMILEYRNGAFTRMPTPHAVGTVFGIWGSSPEDVWAVGGASGGASNPFAWRLENGVWKEAAGFPSEVRGALWKVFGRGAADAWMVGTDGQMLRWDGSSFTEERAAVSESLFTVHADANRFVAVGGFGTGLILENEGDGWVNRSPKGSPPVIGVYLGEESAYAVGQFGAVYKRAADAWRSEETGLVVDESLHSVWIDELGGVWAAGGDVLTKPLVRGVLLHRGTQSGVDS